MLTFIVKIVKISMITDIIHHLQVSIPNKIHTLEDIHTLHRSYINYYFENPHVFRFFYTYQLPTAPSQPQDFEALWYQTYGGFVENGTISLTAVPVIAKTLIYAMQGLLTLYFSDQQLTKEAVYQDITEIINHLLKKETST